MVGSDLKSEINFGNWSVQTYGKDVRDTEMRIQKRRQCPQPPFAKPRTIGYARKKLPAAKVSYHKLIITSNPCTSKFKLLIDIRSTRKDLKTSILADDVIKAILLSRRIINLELCHLQTPTITRTTVHLVLTNRSRPSQRQQRWV